MEFVQWLQSQWAVISAAPLAFIGTIVISAGITAKVMQAYFSSETAAARERADYFKQRLSDLETDKNVLLGKLQAHGEDIAAVKKELADRPRIFVGPDEPKDAKAGDLWFN